jgi:hypothetical protein
MAGSKTLLTEIMATRLPAGERRKFLDWSNTVSNEEFDEGIKTFFAIGEVQDAVADYAIEQLQELEMHCDLKVVATIDVHGRVYRYRQ